MYVKVGERSFLYELSACLRYVKVEEIPILKHNYNNTRLV